MASNGSPETQKALALVTKWLRVHSQEVGADVKRALQELVRRRVGDILLEEGVLAPIDVDRLTRETIGTLEVDQYTQEYALLKSIFTEIASAILVDDEPREVTRWLWMWDKDKDNAKHVEEELFRAIQEELRHRIALILRKSSFVGMSYKIDQAELISELYLKLKRNGIPRLAENREQFYGYAEIAIESILRDMRRAASRKKRPQSRGKEPLIDVFPDVREGQNALQILLDAEDPGPHSANRERLEKHRKALPLRQQRVFRLRTNGVSVAETAEIVGVSVATVKRDYSLAWAQLIKALSAPDDGDPS